jgi:hypothetical protein
MKTELTPRIWLHHAQSLANAVLISSHGRSTVSPGPFALPPNTKFVFTSPRGAPSWERVDRALNGFVRECERYDSANPGPVPNYVLSKFQGGNSGQNESYEDISRLIAETRGTASRVAEKLKVQGQRRDLWNELQNADLTQAQKDQIWQIQTQSMSDPNMPIDMDVVTIRNRKAAWAAGEVTLKDVVIAAQRLNPSYQTFICAFCRVGE